MLGSCGGLQYLFWGVLKWGLALEVGQGACLKDDEILPPPPHRLLRLCSWFN